MTRSEAATVVSLKFGCSLAEANVLCRDLTDEQCGVILTARDAPHGDQIVRRVLDEAKDSAAQEMAVESDPLQSQDTSPAE